MTQPTSVPVLPDSDPAGPTGSVLRLGVADSVRLLGAVVAPTLATGVLKRRPLLMRLTERLGLDRRAIVTMRRLRDRYGPVSVAPRLPGRSFVFPLSEVDVGRVLAGTPAPFTPATTEKRAALRHFQPHAVLVSQGARRQERREFNEQVLRPEDAMHALAPHVVRVVRDEVGRLGGDVDGDLDWTAFNRRWWAAVRRIVLGEAARDDDELTDLLGTLRAAGNWAYLRPRRRRDRARFLAEVAGYVRRAEPGSLAAVVAVTAAPAGVDPAGQVPHWLFAFDAAGMTTFRTLALLARHPRPLQAVRDELDGLDLASPQALPYLRACVLDTVRLWPTTPALLRESTADTRWGPRGTTEFVYTPFFHRDPALPFADHFVPHIWLDGTAESHAALVPFSAGPDGCPGRNVVLLTTGAVLAAVLEHHDVDLRGRHAVGPDHRLPATLDNVTVRLRLTRH